MPSCYGGIERHDFRHTWWMINSRTCDLGIDIVSHCRHCLYMFGKYGLTCDDEASKIKMQRDKNVASGDSCLERPHHFWQGKSVRVSRSPLHWSSVFTSHICYTEMGWSKGLRLYGLRHNPRPFCSTTSLERSSNRCTSHKINRYPTIHS